jgi:hypothetical protein
MGKVTFKAVAWIENERDLLPGDNEYISLVTKVSGGKGASAAGIDPDVDNDWLFLPLVADK